MKNIKRESASNKTFIFLFLFISLSIILFIGGVSAVECNANLNNAGTGCTISSSLILNGTYNININSSGNGLGGGALYILANNLVLDCNGSTIYGNNTNFNESDNSKGIYIPSVNNITIKNCNILNFYTPFTLLSSDNITIINCTAKNGVYDLTALTINTGLNIINSTFENSSSNKAGLVYLDGFNNVNFLNNVFNNAGTHGIDLKNSSNVVFTNTIFNGTKIISNYYSIYASMGNNLSIYNTIVYNARFFSGDNTYSNILIDGFNNFDNHGVESIHTRQTNNVIIKNANLVNTNDSIKTGSGINVTVMNSYFYNKSAGGDNGFLLCTNTNNTYFINNTISLTDYAIFSGGCNNISIINNTISKLYVILDWWGSGIMISDTRDINIIGNNINYTNEGLLIRRANRVLISNNNFYGEPDKTKMYMTREISSAIMIPERYQTWADTAYYDNTSIDSISQNVIIQNNTFDNNVNAYLFYQGTINLTHDITNFWFRSWTFPVGLIDRNYLYISNNWNNLTSCVYGQCTIMQSQGEQSPGNPNWANYSWVKDNYDYYKNLNQTTSKLLYLYNLSSSLISLSNGTAIYLQGQNQNYNITLSPNNYSYVYENYVATEGSPLTADPISIAVSSSHRKTITNSLLNSITVPVDLTNIDCPSLTSITISGNTQTGSDAKTTCNALLSGTTLTLLSGDNYIDWVYGSTPITSSILQILIVILGVGLCIAALAVFYLYAKENYNLIPIEDLVKAIIIFILAEVLIIGLITYIATLV